MQQHTLFVVEPPRVLPEILPFVLVGAVFLVLGFYTRATQPAKATPLVVFGCFVVLAGLLTTLPKVPRHRELYRAYVEGRCQVVEGVVHVKHFESPNDRGHGLGDVVQLGGEEFRVSHFGSGPGYGQSVVYGGVLREGASVRVWLYRGEALRIDSVPRGSPSSLTTPIPSMAK